MVIGTVKRLKKIKNIKLTGLKSEGFSYIKFIETFIDIQQSRNNAGSVFFFSATSLLSYPYESPI